MNPVQRKALRDEVYDRLLASLLSGEITAGERLGIDTVARQFQVSQTPVREAMVELERTGLVAREALKGYRVAPPLDREQLEELLDARLMLEVAAVERIGEASRELAPELHAVQAGHREAADAILHSEGSAQEVTVEQTRRYFDADDAFHRTILERAGNRYVLAMYNELAPLVHRMRQTGPHGPGDVGQAVREHDAIVEAFAQGGDAAVDAMREHIENVRRRSLASAEEFDS